MIRLGDLARALALVVTLSATSCGGSSGTPADGGASGSGGGSAGAGGGSTVGPHGCTNIQGSCTSNGGLSCEEWAGYDAPTVSAFMKSCNHPNQVWSTSPCDTSASVGGCAIVAPHVCNVAWANPPATAAALQMDCGGASQMFVTPP